MSYWLVGKKYDDLLKKKRKYIRVKKWKNAEKEEIFTVLGEKISFWRKRGGGKNIKYLDNIHPCQK